MDFNKNLCWVGEEEFIGDVGNKACPKCDKEG